MSDEFVLSDFDVEGDFEEEEKGKKVRIGSSFKYCIVE